MKAGRRMTATMGNGGCMILLLLMYTIFVLPIMSDKNVKTFVTGKIEMIV
jgi:hypothetical protein